MRGGNHNQNDRQHLKTAQSNRPRRRVQRKRKKVNRVAKSKTKEVYRIISYDVNNKTSNTFRTVLTTPNEQRRIDKENRRIAEEKRKAEEERLRLLREEEERRRRFQQRVDDQLENQLQQSQKAIEFTKETDIRLLETIMKQKIQSLRLFVSTRQPLQEFVQNIPLQLKNGQNLLQLTIDSFTGKQKYYNEFKLIMTECQNFVKLENLNLTLFAKDNSMLLSVQSFLSKVQLKSLYLSVKKNTGDYVNLDQGYMALINSLKSQQQLQSLELNLGEGSYFSQKSINVLTGILPSLYESGKIQTIRLQVPILEDDSQQVIKFDLETEHTEQTCWTKKEKKPREYLDGPSFQERTEFYYNPHFKLNEENKLRLFEKIIEAIQDKKDENELNFDVAEFLEVKELNCSKQRFEDAMNTLFGFSDKQMINLEQILETDLIEKNFQVSLSNFRDKLEEYKNILDEIIKQQFFTDLLASFKEKEMDIEDGMFWFEKNTDFLGLVKSQFGLDLPEKTREIIKTWMKLFGNYKECLQNLRVNLNEIHQEQVRLAQEAQEKLEREIVEQQRLEQERLQKEQEEKERIEQERLQKEKEEKEKSDKQTEGNENAQVDNLQQVQPELGEQNLVEGQTEQQAEKQEESKVEQVDEQKEVNQE